MSARRRLDWLGLTPEPERELPAAVAALRVASGAASGTASGAAQSSSAARAELAAAERRRVEHPGPAGQPTQLAALPRRSHGPGHSRGSTDGEVRRRPRRL